MIPEFPKFKKLELSDKKEIEKITAKFPPYSDFNFVSMWSWDIKEEMRTSVLNGNLVVRFTDYLTGEPFFSFMGNNKVEETVKELISFSEKNYKKNSLRLIPEEITNNLVGSNFNLIPDQDAYDYVYSVSHLSNMHKWPKHSSSRNIRSFSKLYPNYVVKHHSIKDAQQNEYMKMFKKWAENKGIEDCLKLNEYKALERIFRVKQDNINIVSLYVDSILVGFTIYEILSSEYAISHFAKADIGYHRAMNDVLNWEEAKILNSRDVKYFNWEQDLGILGLRESKEKYKPFFFLKKFIVSFI